MKYTPENVKKILEQLSIGMSRDDTCDLVGINRDTFYDWFKNRPDFSDGVIRAEKMCKQRCVVRIQNASRKSWNAAAWLLERKYPDEYGQRGYYQHTGSGGGPLQVAPAASLPALDEPTMLAFIKAAESLQAIEKAKQLPGPPAPATPAEIPPTPPAQA